MSETSNQLAIERAFDAVELQLVEKKRDYIRSVYRSVVKATPKDTGFASNWMIAVGGPLSFAPGLPMQPRYPLPGDFEADQATAGMTLGDDVSMASPAAYIYFLVNPSRPRWGSPQQPVGGWLLEATEEGRQIYQAMQGGA